MKSYKILVFFAVASTVNSWKNIPSIPSNRRSQFYLRHDDGAYNFGYDSGDGIAAHQESTGENQVEGFYSFPNEFGEIVKVKYTAGVQGFVPEIVGQEKAQENSWQSAHEQNVKLAQQQYQVEIQQPTKAFEAPRVQTPARAFVESNDESIATGDASYHISYNTGEQARDEKSDADGNVQGRYSYTDEAGEHDLTYISGPKTGFVVTGGSLSLPNRLAGSSTTSQATNRNFNSQLPAKTWSTNEALIEQKPEDGSYGFSYTADDHSRAESADADGNVQGSYSYTDEAGEHDLTYISGPKTGFVVTGGSLSRSNNIAAKLPTPKPQPKVWSTPVRNEKSWQQVPKESFWASSPIRAAVASNPDINSESNQDATGYSFFYNADSHARQEEADAEGNVRGSYAIRTGTGYEELQYEAGKEGFVVTGGSLAPKPPSWEDSSRQDFGSEVGNQQQLPGFFSEGRFRPLQIPNDHRPYNREKSVQPTFTIVVPSTEQKSFDYGPKNAIVAAFLPPKHDQKHGYIYDTAK